MGIAIYAWPKVIENNCVLNYQTETYLSDILPLEDKVMKSVLNICICLFRLRHCSAVLYKL